MNTEEKLRQYILSRNKSLLSFTQSIDMPYGTIQSIFRRGIMNSSIDNIFKICSALEISADDLAEGKIVPLSTKSDNNNKIDVRDIKHFLSCYLREKENYLLDGIPLNDEEVNFFIDSISLIIDQIRARRNRRDMN